VDILQSSHFYTNIYAGVAGRLLGIPSVGAVRNDLSSEIAANGTLGKWQLRLPSYLIANSELAVSRVLTLGIKSARIHFMRNVVEADKINCLTINFEKDNVHVLFVGRLVPQKNPELFVDLAVRLVRDLPNRRLTFEVAGDGPLRRSLEKLVSESGFAAGQFLFSGTATNIDKVYQQSDIVVLTSEHEGTPNVILEAMARGIPVVATSVGGVPEVLDHERGFLVQSGDLEGLVIASKKLISDPDLRRRLGENGIQYVGDNHSPACLAKSLTDLYAKFTRGSN
jgi:glycosyltransferase involved in cell wall biosynthesis